AIRNRLIAEPAGRQWFVLEHPNAAPKLESAGCIQNAICNLGSCDLSRPARGTSNHPQTFLLLRLVGRKSQVLKLAETFVDKWRRVAEA
ncbi:hypothetical protein E4U31_003622, partial [Claviceps sp. LM219 group G6]